MKKRDTTLDFDIQWVDCFGSVRLRHRCARPRDMSPTRYVPHAHLVESMQLVERLEIALQMLIENVAIYDKSDHTETDMAILNRVHEAAKEALG